MTMNLHEKIVAALQSADNVSDQAWAAISAMQAHSRTPAKAGEDGDHIADAGEMVTQADREAAAKIYDLLGFGPCQHILDGMEDDIGVVAIVVAHRRAALHGDQEG